MTKVLIVEDEVDVLKVLKFRIESAGYQVVCASNGKEALTVLKKETPGLILSDVVMPEMDGFQLYKELKANPATKNIPVLILTARDKMEDTFRVMGVDDFIAKPFQAEELMAKINKLLSPGVAPVSVKPVAPLPPSPVNSGFKVLVAGPEKEAITKIIVQLKERNCAVDFVLSGADIVSKCVEKKPQFVVIDILMPDIPTHELIKLIRQIPQMDQLPIVLYSFYQTEGLSGEDVAQKILSIENAKDLCSEAGAKEYIGAYNEGTFIKKVSQYLK